MTHTKALSAAQIARGECEHGGLKRKCELCEYAAEVADLRTQLAERDAQLAALADGIEWLIPYAKVQQRYVFAPDFQGWCKLVSAYQATRQPTQDKGE